jgi:large repetitive protein
MRRSRLVPLVLAFACAAAMHGETVRRRATDPGLAQRSNVTPVAVSDAYTAAQGASISVSAASGVLSNDSDPQAKPLIAMLLGNPLHGSVTLNSDGSFIYTNDGSGAPVDTFTYKASNRTYESAAATVTITITSAPLPVALNDAYTLAHGATLSVAAPGVLGNDSISGGGKLLAAVVTMPAHGTLTMNGDGSFAYTHDGSSTTSDSFTYRALAGGLTSAPATVTLTISADVAPAVASQTYAATQDTPLTVAAPGVLAGASDPDSRSISAVLVAAPSHGTLALNNDGSFVYMPATGYSGIDSFTFKATDGIFSSVPATATITVSGSPFANPDSYAATSGSSRTVPAPGVLGNDALAGGKLLSYGASTAKEQTTIGAATPTPAGGSVALNGDGSFTYTAPANYAGFDTFRYLIGTAGANAIGTVTMTVQAAPVAKGDAYDVAQNVPRSILSPGVLANDTPNGATPAVSSAPQHGTLTLNSDGSFLYSPLANFAGGDSFTYALSNFAGTSFGTVTLTVWAAPVASGDTYANASASTFAVGAPGVLGNDTPAFATLTSYGKTGSEQTVIGQPTPTTAGGVVTLSANGSFTYTPPAGGQTTDTFRYTLANYAGSSTATVTITSVAPPIAVADSYTATRNTTLSTAAAKGVLANDTPNGAKIASYGANGVEQPTAGQPASTAQGGVVILNADGSFSYTPPSLFTGTDLFRYALSNSSGSSLATVTITVAGAPVAVNDVFSATLGATLVIALPGVLTNDTLTTGAAIASYGKTGSEQSTIGQPTPTTNGGTVSLNADGSFSYMPAAVTGADTFHYILSSFAGASTAMVTINVGIVPVAVADSYPVAANGSRTEPATTGVLANDTLNGAILASYGKSTGLEQPTAGAATLTAQGGSITLRTDGSFTYVAPLGFAGGTDTFNYRLTNASGSATATVSLLVSGAPLAVADSYRTQPNTQLVIGGGGTTVLKNDTVNNAAITGFGAVSGTEQQTLGQATPTAQNGSVTLNADGSFTYTPAQNFAGSDSFRYTLTNFIGSSTATVMLLVSNAPGAVDDSYDAAQNTPRTVAAAQGVLANDAVNTGVIASYGANGNEPTPLGQQTATLHGGTIALNADGSFTYRPPSNYAGLDTFAYTLTNAAGSSTATVTMHVWAPPVAVNDAQYAVAAGQTLTIALPGVLGNDSVNGATITGYGSATGSEQSAVGQATPTATGGSVSLNADGSFTYSRTDTTFSGTDAFRYTLTNYAGTSTATVTITVSLLPVVAGDSYSAAPGVVRTITAPGVLANDTPNGATLYGYGPFTGTEQKAIGNAAGTEHSGRVVMSADGSFVYTPPAAFTGFDTFRYTLSNAAGQVTGTVTIAVFGLPVPVDDSYQTAPGVQLVVGSGGQTVLKNDSVNNAMLTGYGINGNEQTTIGQPIATMLGGTIALNADGSFTYTPPANLLGTDSVKYTLTNYVGNAVATVHIGVSTLPLPQPDAYSAALNTTLTVNSGSGVLANDTLNAATISGFGVLGTEAAPGAQTSTVANGKVTLNADGSFVYIPPPDVSGNDSFNYTLKNAAGQKTANVAITIFAPPVVVNDAYDVTMNGTRNEPKKGVLTNDTLNGGAIVSYGATTGSEQQSVGQSTPTSTNGGFIALNADGSFTYSAPPNIKGTDSFRYVVKNYAGNPSGLVVMTIWAAPAAVADAYTVAARTSSADSATSSSVLANDTVNGAAIVSYGIAGTEQTVISQDTVTAHGTVRINSDGTFVYNPTIGYSGTDSFQYKLSNFAGASIAKVTMSVVASPAASNQSYDLLSNSPLVIQAPGVLSGATTNGATIVSYGRTGTEAAPGSATTTAQQGAVTLRSDGSFNYSPAQNFSGADSFLYVLQNVAGNSTGTVTLNVWSAPAAADDSYTLASNSLQTLPATGVLKNDTQNRATIVSFGKSGTEGPPGAPQTTDHGTVTLFADGSFTYQASVITYNGPDTFSYKLSNFAGTSGATVTITVVAPPALTDDSYDTGRGTDLTVAAPGVLDNDNVNGGTLATYGATGTEASAGSSTGTTQGGKITLNADGSFTYKVPSSTFTGNDTFKYTIANTATSTVATVTLHVIGPADAVDDPSYLTNVGATLTVNAANGVLKNDTPAGTLTIVSFGSNGNEDSATGTQTGTSAGGKITLNADGSFTYIPPPSSYYGADTFKYIVKNVTSTDTATVTVTNATPPVAQPDPGGSASYPLSDDLQLALVGNDTLNGATVATYGSSTMVPPGAITLTARGNGVVGGANGFALHFAGGSAASGIDTFDYTISNPAGSSKATVTLRAGAPFAAGDEIYGAGTTNQLLANDLPDASLLAVTTWGPNGNDTAAGNPLTISGVTIKVDADGTCTVAPSTVTSATIVFKYTIKNTASSAVGTAVGVVVLHIGPVSSFLALGTQSYTATKNQTLLAPAGSLLNNLAPFNGLYSMKGSAATTQGGFAYVFPDGSFIYTPPPDFTGTDSFPARTIPLNGEVDLTVNVTVQ